jgi:hypothetical protein
MRNDKTNRSSEHMKTENPAVQGEKRILVEGPAWGDARFYGNWLLSAATANELMVSLKKNDPEFRRAAEAIETIFCLDFGIAATVFLKRLADTAYETFILDPASEDLIDFVLMSEMGFFSLTGERYQMTSPSHLDANKVKQAHIKLAETEDEEWIHPERLVVDMPCSRAETFQQLLGKMNQGQRLADRHALLFLD